MTDRIADELAIRALTARFNHLADQRRNEECAATFVENGVLEIRGERLEGRPAIAAHLESPKLGSPVDIGFGVMGRMGSTVHATTDNLITIEGDEATQLSYMMVFLQAPRDVAGDGLLVATERFEDRLVRTDVGWLFEQRSVTILRTNAIPDVTMGKVELAVGE